MTYRFAEYSPEYMSRIAELRSRVFGGDHAFSTEYFEWKYERNPYIAVPHFYVALHEDDVVAMRGFYGSRWQAGQQSGSLLIPIGGDLAVDLDHRRHKLASRLVTFITEHMTTRGYTFLMNLSANSSSRRLQIRARYPRVAAYRTFRYGAPRTNRLTRVLQRAKRALVGRHREAPFQRFDSWAAGSGGPILGASQARASQMGDLVLRYADNSRIRLVRDAEFYRWRFMNPASEYRFIYHFDDSGGLNGFLVLQSAKGGGWTTIIDWETSTPAVWNVLVNAATMSNPKRLKITSTAFTEDQVHSLHRLGFSLLVEPDSPSNPAPGMLLHVPSNYNAGDPKINDLRVLDASSWDIRMIASDAF